MQLSKQIINLLGVVLVAALLTAGILLGAMPLYLESRSVGKQADDAVQTNSVYEVQVQALRADAERIDEIQLQLTDLRAEIPAAPRIDDVFALVNRAAAGAGVTIQSARASDAEPWTPRTPPGEDPAPAAPAPEQTPADAQDATADAAAQTGSGAGQGAEAASAPATPKATPETQVPVTVVVLADDTASAARFAEALGAGPRLLGVTHVNMTAATDGYTLTIDGLAFVRTEK